MAGIDVTPGKRSSDGSAATESSAPPPPGKLRQRTLRFWLGCLVLACVVPVCVIAGFLVHHAYQQRRNLLEQRVLETTRALSMVVDQQFATMQASAEALAVSPSLASGNLAAFDHQARMVVHDHPGYVAALSDARGQELVNTAVPFGTPLPIRGALDVMQRVFATGKPAITNLYEGTRSGRSAFGIHVPVFRGRRVVYDLELSEHSEDFQKIFSQERIPSEWTIAILDANREVVARSRSSEASVGKMSNPALVKRMAGDSEGSLEQANLEGTKSLIMFHQATSGWAVVIGVPKAVLTADLRRWLWWTVGGGLLLFMVGLVLALFLARRIAGSIQALIAPAMALGTGEPVKVQPLDLAETNKVSQSLVEASQLLQQRTAERKRAESALQNTLQRFYVILSSMYSAVLLVTDEGRVEFANQAFCDRFGLEDAPADLVGLNDGSMIAKIKNSYRYPREAIARIRQLVDRRQPVLGEEVAMQGGKTCLRDFVPLNMDGKLYGRLWIHVDITERRQAEEEREATVEFLRLVNLSRGTRDLIQRATTFFQGRSNCSAVGIRLQDGGDFPYFECRGFSKEFVQAENYLCKRDESGLPILDNEGHPALDCMCGNVIRGRFDLSKPFFTALGSFWTNSTTELLATTTAADRQTRTRNRCNGEGYESVALIALRIGEQRLGLIQLNDRQKGRFTLQAILLWERLAGYLAAALSKFRAEEALHESEDRLRVALDSAQFGTFDFHLLTDDLIGDAQMKKIWGILPDEQLDYAHAIERIHPDDRERVSQIVAASLAPNASGHYEAEYRIIWPDGTVHWTSARGRVHFQRQGEQRQAVRMVGVQRDITERKLAQEALLRSEKLASVGRMAATIAHEINNPLEAVTNLLYLARNDNDLPESASRHLEVMDTELARIAHITRQSLGFYRESNAPAITSINAVLESAIGLLKSKIKAKEAVIEKQWDGSVEVTAVAGELRQVFSNLLANSLDAIDRQGTIKLRVSTRTASDNGRRSVRITIADNGKGIDLNARQHLFEPFFTTKGTVGTGLGLWVSKQIIDKHSGTIRMRSRSSGARHGTAFSVVLPTEPAAAVHSQSAGA
jgi:PAS domain S-box-containing protein